MIVTIDLISVLTGLLIICGVVLLIFLVIAIARLIQTLTKVNKLLDQIHEPVAATTRQLPDLVGKFDRISGNIELVADSAKATIPPVLDDVKTVTNTVRESVTSVGDTVHEVSDDLHGFFAGKSDTAVNIGSVVSIVTTAFDIISHFIPQKSKSRKRRSRRR